MAREWREEYRGGIYHVIARENNKEYIFRENIDKGYFIKLLRENMQGMNYKLYGYLLALLRYIHQNPIAAGMCDRIEDYRWSSDIFYRTNNSIFISIDVILDMLSSEKNDAISKYSDICRRKKKKITTS